MCSNDGIAGRFVTNGFRDIMMEFMLGRETLGVAAARAAAPPPEEEEVPWNAPTEPSFVPFSSPPAPPTPPTANSAYCASRAELGFC